MVANVRVSPEGVESVCFVIQEDEGEARGRNSDGASVGGSVARNTHNVQFTLEIAVELEVGIKALASPCEVTFCSDMVGEEVLGSNGWRCASRLFSIATADGDGDAQVVGA